MQVKKVIKYLIIITTIVLINIILENNVQAVTQTVSTDINGIDESKYPGVKQMIQTLQYQYPNWNFKVLYTGLTFDEVITNEYIGHRSSPRNLVSSTHTGEWLCSICTTQTYDNGSWYCTSETALKYMIDPRNSINSSDVFQFMELTYTDCSYDSIKSMVSGTFLDNDSYINTILTASKNNNISAYYVVALAIQEQGSSGGGTVSGTYSGYEGYYNIFNIKATGSGSDAIIKNGLEYAKTKGWTSIEKSIEGGIEEIVSGYINRGQNTLYFQKFDVEASDGNLYWHQYQQNVLAAQNEGVKIRKILEEIGAMDSSYTFIIPLYENTPTTICKQPNSSSSNSIIESDVVYINAVSLRLRNAPNGTYIATLNENEIVTRLEKATEQVEGYYWDKIMRADGTVGYVARETSTKLYLVPVEIENNTSEEEPNESENSNGEDVDILTDKIKVETSKKLITIIPGASLQDLNQAIGYDITIQDANGNTLENVTTIATGYKLNNEYKISVLGDVSGDGIVDSRDSLRILKYSVGTYSLTEEFLTAADINKDGIVDSRDSLRILKYSVGTFNIEI